MSLSSFAVGLVLLGCGQRPTGVSVYNKALEINPKYSEAYNNRGIVYGEKGQHDRAIADYNKALEFRPNYAKAYNNRGAAYENKGLYDRAIGDFNKTLEINPKFALAYRNRGFLYMVKLRKKERACPDWKQACELGLCGNYNLAKRRGLCR